MSQENLPNSVLYAISARIGGVGLDLVAHETIRGIQPFLGKAISYGVQAPDIDRRKMKTLRFHPVRLLSLSNLDRKYYYAAKKRAVDRVAAQFLKTGRFDLFHVWSGSALHALRVAKSLGIPSLLEIPTWHRQKGKVLPPKMEHEIAMENAPIPQRWLYRLLISRQESLEEYELADLLLVESEKAADSFRVLGFPNAKLYSMPQGVDVNRFQPGPPPPLFRAVFAEFAALAFGPIKSPYVLLHISCTGNALFLPTPGRARADHVGHADGQQPGVQPVYRDVDKVKGEVIV